MDQISISSSNLTNSSKMGIFDTSTLIMVIAPTDTRTEHERLESTQARERHNGDEEEQANGNQTFAKDLQ